MCVFPLEFASRVALCDDPQSQMSEFHDDSTVASDSLPLQLSDVKLRRLQPELYGPRAWFFKHRYGLRQLNAGEARNLIAEHLRLGDTMAALVLSTDPLIVGAYCEQDAVLLLRFSSSLVAEHDLQVGDKLLTVNTYGRGKRLVADLTDGPLSTRRWMNCHPIIADFVSDDRDLIAQRKQTIRPLEWRRVTEFGKAKLAIPGATVRDGRPLHSSRPGQPLRPHRS